jgi:hypothetical protein
MMVLDEVNDLTFLDIWTLTAFFTDWTSFLEGTVKYSSIFQIEEQSSDLIVISL